MLGDAIVHLGWSPATFWASTHHEYQAAMEAQLRANAAQEEAARRAGRGR